MDLLELPYDLQESVLNFCLVTNPSISRCSKKTNQLSTPLLYHRVKLTSASQLGKFIASDSGSFHCMEHAHGSLIIKVPGVPGPSFLSNSEDDSHGTMIKASRAILKCPKIRSLSLQFYSVSHSTFSTSSIFREMESNLFKDSLSQLNSLKSFSWYPPGKGNDEEGEEEKVMGLSIAVVPELIPSLVEGLRNSSPNLEHFEMKNVMFGEKDGGLSLFEMLKEKRKLRSFSLESVTSLNPKGVAILALSSIESNQDLQITISDGFLDSIWGPRLLKEDIEVAMRLLLKEKVGLEERDLELQLERALNTIRLREIPGGVGGMF